MMMNRRPANGRSMIAVASMATLLATTACGSSSTTTEVAGPQGTDTSIESAPTGAGVTDYLDYVGGTAGAADANASPVTIGWINSQGGPAAIFPEATEAATAAVKYINSELGGIDGHPLKLSTCFIAQAEEEGNRCGQQIVNDDSISVVALGNVVAGNQAFAGVNKGLKPVIAGVDVVPSDAKAANTYILYGDGSHVFGAFGTYAKTVLKATSAALVFAQQPDTNAAADAARSALASAGLTVKSVGYGPTTTDLIGPITTAGVQSAGVIVPVTDPPGCVNMAKTLAQIASSTPVLSSPLCLAPVVAKGLGDFPVGWTFGSAQTLATDPNAADAKHYLATAPKYGLSAANAVNVYAGLAWGEILTITKVLNSIGADKITPATVTAAMKAYDGPLVLGPSSVKCGHDPKFTAVCNVQSRFYTYQGKGQFTSTTGWIAPS